MTKCGMGGVWVVAAATLALSIRCVFARTYVVGQGYCLDTALWSPYCSYYYWPLQYEFAVGDTLVFNFRLGESTVVAPLYKTDYDRCTTANYIPYYLPPVTVTLLSTGTFYFVSVVNGFCYQKLTVIVKPPSPPATPGWTPPTTPGWTPPATPRGTPSSSSSNNDTTVILVAVFGVVFFIIKISLIVYCCHRRRGNQNPNAQGPRAIQVDAPQVNISQGDDGTGGSESVGDDGTGGLESVAEPEILEAGHELIKCMCC